MSLERTTIMQEFAEFVRNKRMAMGMKQEDLAEIIYGDKRRKAYISAIENGKKDVSLATVDLILQALKSGIEFIE